jgi:hypothetical protein
MANNRAVELGQGRVSAFGREKYMWLGFAKQVRDGSLALVAIIVLFCGFSARAAIITEWTFESYTPPASATTNAGPFAPETSVFAAASSGATGVHATASTYGNVVGNGSAKAFSSNTWATGDYYQFSTPTTGFTGIQLLVDHTSSGTGPTSFKVAYSTNGTTFTDLPGGSYTIDTSQSFSSAAEKSTTPPRFLFDLSSISALDNQPQIFLRLIDTFPTGASGGTSRVDNVTVGTNLPVPPPLPEPSSLMLLGVVALVARRRPRG